MAFVLRYVTKAGFIQERLLDLIHVPDTGTKTLKDDIFFLLDEHKLSVENIRGQGYDGASNMMLQLILVVAAKVVRVVYGFFDNKLLLIINFVGGSCKRIEELEQAQTNEIELLIAHDDVDTGRVFTLLEVIRDGPRTASQRGDAESAYKTLVDFEFVFILSMMKEILEISNDLFQLLQWKSQDIVNAMDPLRSTKLQIQQLKDVGWAEFLEKVKLFCEKEGISTPGMNYIYCVGRALNSQRQQAISPLTVEHHYHFDVFNATIDSNLTELNNRFSETINELMVLCVALDPRDGYKMFNIENICQLVARYYPDDFTDPEKDILKIQLRHYKKDVTNHPKFKNLSLISELCQTLGATRNLLFIHLLID